MPCEYIKNPDRFEHTVKTPINHVVSKTKLYRSSQFQPGIWRSPWHLTSCPTSAMAATLRPPLCIAWPYIWNTNAAAANQRARSANLGGSRRRIPGWLV